MTVFISLIVFLPVSILFLTAVFLGMKILGLAAVASVGGGMFMFGCRATCYRKIPVQALDYIKVSLKKVAEEEHKPGERTQNYLEKQPLVVEEKKLLLTTPADQHNHSGLLTAVSPQ